MRDKAQVLNQAIAYFELAECGDSDVMDSKQSTTLQLGRHR